MSNSRGKKPVVQCTRAEWQGLVNRFRACCPPPEGYDWQFVWSESLKRHGNLAGDCDRIEGKNGKRGRIVVRIERGLSENETLLMLMHEMAHAYDAWTHHGWADDHSDTFWIWHGRIYRRYWRGDGD